MDSKPKIIYVVDPMCSWCWAFSPQISALREHYASAVDFAMIPGILRSGGPPWTTRQITDLGGLWQKVARQTGQQFTADFSPPSGFVYDTEPACRALVTLREMRPTAVFDYLAALHAAFYVRHVDITDERHLITLAADFEVDVAVFATQLRSNAMRVAARAAYSKRLELGVDGFPTLLLCKNQQVRGLTRGYQSAVQIAQVLESMLTEDE